MGSTTLLLILWTGPRQHGAASRVDQSTPAAPDLAALVEAELPEWRVQELGAAWDDGKALAAALAAARDGVVLVAAPTGRVSPRRIQDVAARAGLDPLAVHVVDPWLGHGPDPGSAGTSPAAHTARVLAAAAARAAAAGPIPPEARRLRLPLLTGSTSRRNFLAALRPHFELVPAVDAARCYGAGGCSLCATACPIRAIALDGGKAVIGEDCNGCGACTSACPTGAITHPGATPTMVAAQVETWLRSAPPPAVVAYACPTGMAALAALSGGDAALPAGVLPVPVPCAAAVTVHQLMLPLESGAAAVAVLACPARCRYGAAPTIAEGAVGFARDLLQTWGLDARRVILLLANEGRAPALAAVLAGLAQVSGAPTPAGPAPLPAATATPMATVRASAPATGALDALADLVRRRSGQGALAGPSVPFGQLALATERCSFCGLCTGVCPTGALTLIRDETVRLQFEPLACAACGACVTACPEQALTLARALDLGRAPAGAYTLALDTPQHCRRCGTTHMPGAAAARIRERLAAGAEPPNPSYLEYCPTCRLALSLGLRRP